MHYFLPALCAFLVTNYEQRTGGSQARYALALSKHYKNRLCHFEHVARLIRSADTHKRRTRRKAPSAGLDPQPASGCLLKQLMLFPTGVHNQRLERQAARRTEMLGCRLPT